MSTTLGTLRSSFQEKVHGLFRDAETAPYRIERHPVFSELADNPKTPGGIQLESFQQIAPALLTALEFGKVKTFARGGWS